MRFLTDDPERIAGWLGEKIGGDFHRPYTVIGAADNNGRIIAGALFNNFNGHDVELSLAGRFTRLMWWLVATYTWDDLKVARVTLRVRASNTRAIKLAHHWGAKPEGLIRKYYPDNEDAVLFGLLKEECHNEWNIQFPESAEPK